MTYVEKRQWVHRGSRIAHNERRRRQVREARAELIASWGGCCQRCGFDDPRALDFDHIVAVHRRTNGIERGSTGNAVLRKVRSYPELFQLLCANCHRIKTVENGDHVSWREGERKRLAIADLFAEECVA